MCVYRAPRAAQQGDAFALAPRAEIACCPWPAFPTAPAAFARVCWQPDALLVRLTALESDPKITYRQPNDPVYQDSCLEFFIAPLPDRPAFCDFELNAAGTLLVGHYHNGDFGLIDPAHRPDFAPRAVRLPDRWQVTFTIPAAFLESRFPGFCYAAGEPVGANFYKCGDHTAAPHYACWSPIHSEKPDFFHPECFGRIFRV